MEHSASHGFPGLRRLTGRYWVAAGLWLAGGAERRGFDASGTMCQMISGVGISRCPFFSMHSWIVKGLPW